MACGVGAVVVGPHFLSALVCRGLSSVAIIVVVVGGTLGGGIVANISSMGGGCYGAHKSATGFSSALIRMASKVN